MEAVLDFPKVTGKNDVRVSRFEQDVVQTVVLHDISWDTYEKILAEHVDAASPHFAYCDGDLEIMVLGYRHENLKTKLSELLTEIARVLEIDYESAGSTTFRLKKKQKGFESDGSFYFKNAETVRGRNEINLSKDPPPELAIEIDITHGSLPKFPIFAGLEIEEIWRFDGEGVKFYRLQNENYAEIGTSVCLPNVKGETVTELLFAAQKMKRFDWVKLIHRKIKQ